MFYYDYLETWGRIVKANVLFIDDDLAMLDFYRHTADSIQKTDLKINAHFCQSRADFRDLLPGLKHKQIVMAFVDLKMPEMKDGLNLAHELQNHWPDIQLVFVSSCRDLSFETVNQIFARPQKLVFLPKPIRQDELAHNIQHTLSLIEQEELRKKIVSNITKEMRIPLTIMKGFADLLRDTQNLNKQQLEYIDALKQNIETLIQQTQDLNFYTDCEHTRGK